MDILSISIIIFCILESLNVIILYFKPTSKIGNGVGVFNILEDIKNDTPLNLFIHYLIYWVAGVKLIFIFLLMVIVFTGSELTKLFTVIFMILSISTYFIKLHPIIKNLDELGKITPKGYSKTLKNMILGFLSLFTIALFIYFFNK